MADPSGGAVLEYANAAALSAAASRPRRLRAVVFALSLASLAVPFLPFVAGVTPASVAMGALNKSIWTGGDVFIFLGLGFFVAFPVVLWKARLLFGRATRVERVMAAALVAACWAPHVIVLMRLGKDLFGSSAWHTNNWADLLRTGLVVVSAYGVPALGLVLAAGVWRGGDPDEAIGAGMVTPYLANAGMCLAAFAIGPPERGYQVAAVVVLWTIDLARLAWEQLRRRTWWRRGGD